MEAFLILIVIIVFIIIIANSSKSKKTSPKTPSYSINTQSPKVEDGYKTDFRANTENDSYKKRKNNYKWIGYNQTTTVDGFTISGGLLYFGLWLASDEYNYKCEASLINPKLVVNKDIYDYQGTDLHYWPTYQDLSPKGRAKYLNWLASGKNDPTTNIGFVFLYFYGLERRLLIDLKENSEEDLNEAEIILNEIIRLIQIYENNSFHTYASGLLSFAAIKFNKTSLISSLQLKTAWGDYPVTLKLSLADYALKSKPLPANIAFNWLKNDPNTFFRTPAQRCKEEFEQLFFIKYNTKFGERIILHPNKTPIKIEYRVASGTLSGNFVKSLSDTPDLTKSSKYINKFREIATECENELDAYSRYLGRNPEEAKSIAAISLLPKELFNSKSIVKVEEVKTELQSKIGESGYGIVEIENLLKIMNYDISIKLSKGDATNISMFIEKVGYGIEPDVRFDSPIFKMDEKAVIFFITNSFPSVPSTEYSAVKTIISFAAAVSAADGSFSEEEKKLLISHVESSLDLKKEDLIRLKAYIIWTSLVANDLKVVSRRIKNLSNSQKLQLLNFLLSLANADGYISPEEIKSLRKVYKLLEIEENKLYSDLHTIQSGMSELTTILPGSTYQEVYRIPNAEEKKKNLELNEEIIESTLRDTNKVKEILTNIFAEEDIPKKSEEASIALSEYSHLGLDKNHSILLLELIKKAKWSREAYEDICLKVGIFPDGAIEAINDSTFEKFGDDLIFEEEQIEINSELIKYFLPNKNLPANDKST